MKNLLIWAIALLFSGLVQAQSTLFIDTLFSIQTYEDSVYGTATDYGGFPIDLKLDISVPVGDTPISGGRPLMILVHGGAFLQGSKEDGTIVRMREDFAKRGYVTAAVNYRLGMFGPPGFVNCNISPILGAPWNCLNVQDSSEWYRAWHRAVQDVHGAIRYMVNRSADYQLNPQKVFVVGVSAGGFTALGAGFLSDSEVNTGMTGSLSDAAKPNALYESCLPNAIDNLDLSRPDLGSIKGTLNNPTSTNYKIAGVGSFFGGAFYNFFETATQDTPVLYMFHQKDDMIVPFTRHKLFAKYAACATSPPWNCGWIQGRPWTFGSDGIANILDTLSSQGKLAPTYMFQKVTTSADCNTQLFTAGAQQHAIDNYWLRTSSMATHFYPPAIPVDKQLQESKHFSIFPNPLHSGEALTVRGPLERGDKVTLIDLYGREIYRQQVEERSENIRINAPTQLLGAGLYLLRIKTSQGTGTFRLIIGK